MSSPLQNLLSLTETSPLTEADPKSLDELMRRAEVVFNMKPMDLTDVDIDAARDYYRAKRGHFAQLAREKESAPKTRRSPAKSVAEALVRNIPEIDL